MNFKLYTIFLITFLVLITGCQKEEPLKQAVRGQLLESSFNGRLNKSDVVERITETSENGFVSHGVNYHVITYRTEYMGKPIDSRGLLLLPKEVTSADLIMYCHGTQPPTSALDLDRSTPSLYDGSKKTHIEVRNMGLAWASAGYVVFIPDYIGYGLTLGKDHPYVYYPEMFISNIDGLLATKEFLNNEGIAYDNKLFLTGWSQGASASLSTHKYIQEGYANEFTIVASSGLSGPYNFTRFGQEVLAKKSEAMLVTPIFSWGVYSINKFSAIKRPTDQIYSYPVFDQISSVLGPSTKPKDVFNPYFIEQIMNKTDTAFVNEMKRNSLHHNWKPIGKVFLHHGDADELVPYYNSVDALNGLSSAGGDVSLYTFLGGKHNTELGDYLVKTLNDFNSLK